MAANYWVEAVGLDAEERMKEDKEQRLNDELDKFLDSAVGFSSRQKGWI